MHLDSPHKQTLPVPLPNQRRISKTRKKRIVVDNGLPRNRNKGKKTPKKQNKKNVAWT